MTDSLLVVMGDAVAGTIVRLRGGTLRCRKLIGLGTGRNTGA